MPSRAHPIARRLDAIEAISWDMDLKVRRLLMDGRLGTMLQLHVEESRRRLAFLSCVSGLYARPYSEVHNMLPSRSSQASGVEG